MEFVGMGNWEQVHTFAAVCKFWRHVSLPHLSNTGKVYMDGGAEQSLNVSALSSIGAFQNCAVYFYPMQENKVVSHEWHKVSMPKC